jgi:hypothetical protein
MRRFDAGMHHPIAEEAAPLIGFHRLRRDLERASEDPLAGSILRQATQVAARIGDGRAVRADRDVAKVVKQWRAPGGRTRSEDPTQMGPLESRFATLTPASFRSQ